MSHCFKFMVAVLFILWALPASPSDIDTAEMDAENTGIGLDDPLALSKLEKLIETVALEKGVFSTSLYRPLRQAGLLSRFSDPERSLEYFKRMQHLVHRHYGVYSVIQLESIDLMLRTYQLLRSPYAMNTQHEFRYRVASKSYDNLSDEHGFAALKLADWYRNSMQHRKATELYGATRTQFENKEDHSVTARILRSEALTLYLTGRCCAVDKLREAMYRSLAATDSVGVLEAVADFVDMSYLEDEEVTLPETGDLDLPINMPASLLGYKNPAQFHEISISAIFGKRSSPRSKLIIFPKDENLFNTDGNEPDTLAMGSPVSICRSTFEQLVTGKDDISLDVVVQVDEFGSPEKVAVSGSAPISLVNFMKDTLRESKYRPALDERGLASPGRVSFRQTFHLNDAMLTSAAPVSSWSNQLVAQSCHLLSAYI